jgi:hypothetical protein
MSDLGEATIGRLVAELTSGGAAGEAAWTELKVMGAGVIPHLAAAFGRTRRWQGRTALLFYTISYARQTDAAIDLALRALGDRSYMVRYRACMVLAYSLRSDVLSQLQALTTHVDERTRADARAAIDAIESQNHHLFVDRDHSGHSFWHVNPGDTTR